MCKKYVSNRKEKPASVILPLAVIQNSSRIKKPQTDFMLKTIKADMKFDILLDEKNTDLCLSRREAKSQEINILDKKEISKLYTFFRSPD